MKHPEHSSHGVYPEWLDLIYSSWPAVVASDLLQGSPNVWNQEGLEPPSRPQMVVIATIGRMFRYGQSLKVSVPIGSFKLFPKLAFYLHRLRMDGMAGFIKSPWLNPITVKSRTDLIIFGRTKGLWREFSTSAVMRPEIVNSRNNLEYSEFQRTLLVNGQGDLLEDLDNLKLKSNAFALIIDISQNGCSDSSNNLLKVLPYYFPDVPIFAIGSTGQFYSEVFPMHHWCMRVCDSLDVEGDIKKEDKYEANIKVLYPSDQVYDGVIKKLGYLIWGLSKKLDEVYGGSPELSALKVIYRTLHSLNLPLNLHEQATSRYARSGRFAVRTIESWIEIASRLKGRRGDIHDLHSQIMSLIKQLVCDLTDAETGRCELIYKLCSQALNRNNIIYVLVGGKRDAEILQSYLELRLGPESIGKVKVIPMDGIISDFREDIDLLIFAGVLYPSRLHWLGLSAVKKVVISHFFEKEKIAQLISTWHSNYYWPSVSNGHKYQLWNLNFKLGEKFLDDKTSHIYINSEVVICEEVESNGNYPIKLRTVTLDTKRGFDDWLDSLIAEPIVLNGGDGDVSLRETPNVFVLHLEGISKVFRWPTFKQISRLQGEEIEVCSAGNLNIGDELIIIINSEEQIATQREIFDLFCENNHGLEQSLRIADKWNEYVTLGYEKLEKSLANLHKYLNTNRLFIHKSTVQNWLNGGVIGPQDPNAIRLFAELAQVPNASKMSQVIAQAISLIRTEHRRVGGDIRRAIAISRGRDVSAVQIGTRRFSREIFDSMIQVAKISHIQRSSVEQIDISRQGIKDIAKKFAMQYPNKLLFTQNCERVMRNSEFLNIESFNKILEVLINGFYPMYMDKSKSLKEVEEMLAPIPASYAAGMSEITKGKFEQEYFRFYEGRKIDISRHIKLGRAHDPKYTLRLHFHWDDERSQIVIHHAGEHLPTLRN